MKLHALFIAAALISSAALAETKTASSQVSLTVLPDCTISATDIDLGVYNFRTGASGAGTVRVKCNVKYIQLKFADDLSSNSSSDFSFSGVTLARNLTGASATIPYSARFQFIPVGSTGQYFVNQKVFTKTSSGFAIGASDNVNNIDLPVKVTVAPGLWKPAGQYTDLITYTLDYTP